MNKKVIPFLETSNGITQNQKKVLEEVKKIMKKQSDHLLPDSTNDQILLKQTDKVLTMILNDNLLNKNQVEKYFKIVNQFSEIDQEEVSQYLDIATYTCMIEASKKQVLELTPETIETIICILVATDIPVTSYKKYLDILLKEEVINTITTFQGKVPVDHIITDLFYEMDFSRRNPNLIYHNFLKNLKTIIQEYLDTTQKQKLGSLIPPEELNGNGIYYIIKEQMDRLNELTDFELFTKDQFQTLEKVRKFILLPTEDRKSFFNEIQKIDLPNLSLLEKIGKILMCIESYSKLIKKDTNIITPNFTSKRK